MPATQLDPQSALIVIDLQQGIVGLPCVHPVAEVVAQTRTLLDAFRAAGQTVVLVNVAGTPSGRAEAQRPAGAFPAGWTELIPELDAQPSDLRITKRSWGAFAGTALESELRAAGVTQLVLAGIATSIGVESTAREAFALGFNVTLAVDAMTDLNADAHANSVARIFPRLGETGRAADIAALLGQRPA